MEAAFPLWRKSAKILAGEFIEAGFEAVVVAADAAVWMLLLWAGHMMRFFWLICRMTLTSAGNMASFTPLFTMDLSSTIRPHLQKEKS